MPDRPSKLIDVLRSKTGGDDLLRTLLKAQAARSRTAEATLTDNTRVRVTALHADGERKARR